MLRFSILSLFPEVITAYTQASIVGRAQIAGVIAVDCINPRNYSSDLHHKVDDSPYGGGAGMVLACQPILDAAKSLLPFAPKTRLLLTSPGGKRFDQAYARELAASEQLVIFCGHYEGFDERLLILLPQLTGIPIEMVSIGDFVLTGGELPALCIVDAVTRMLPGAVQKQDSVICDAFYDAQLPRLDHPHYTRPPVFEGLEVPSVLRSGDHKAIAQWRAKMALYHTWRDRPDLLVAQTLTPAEKHWIQEFEASVFP